MSSSRRHDGWDMGDDAPFRIHLLPLEGITKAYDLNMIYIAGPGYGAWGVVAQTRLDGDQRARLGHRA